MVKKDIKKGCLVFNRRVLRFLGLWPEERDIERHTVASWFRFLLPRLVLVRCLYAPFLTALSMQQIWGQTLPMIEEVVLLIGVVLIASKVSTLFWFRRRVADLVERLQTSAASTRASSDDGRCEALRRNADVLGHALSVGFVVAVGVVFSVGVQVAVLLEALETGEIPYRRWMPFERSESPLFEASLIFTLFFGVLDFALIPIADTLFVSIALQFVAQFKMLGLNLQQIRHNAEMKVLAKLKPLPTHLASALGRLLGERIGPLTDSLIPDSSCETSKTSPRASEVMELTDLEDEVHKDSGNGLYTFKIKSALSFDFGESVASEMEILLADWVTDHVTLIGMCQEFQQIFNGMLHCQIAIGILLSMIGIYVEAMAASSDSSASSLVIGIVYLICGIIELAAFCVTGDLLTEHSASIREAAYACDWLEATEGFKRSLRIIMARTAKPVVLTAAGVALSLPKLRLILRIAYYARMLGGNIVQGKKFVNTRS